LSFLLIWKEMLFVLICGSATGNEMALSVNDGFRMPRGPQIGVEKRTG
jgi:hypothetical protein